MVFTCTVCHKKIGFKEEMIMYDILYWAKAESDEPHEISEIYFHVKCNPIYFNQVTKEV